MTVALHRQVAHSPQAELGPVGWVAGAELAYDEWLRQGSRLGLAGRSAAWWIGDWVRYGTARYGSKYTAAARVTGYDPQTLMNMVYVASRFEISRRRESLSWSHHADVAALETEDQERWLNRAIAERFSVRDLREMLGSAKQPAGRSSAGREAMPPGRSPATALGRVTAETRSHAPKRASTADTTTVVCPHCGQPFVHATRESDPLGASDEE
jgi:hypothetical protein